jgi:hypothetical protein
LQRQRDGNPRFSVFRGLGIFKKGKVGFRQVAVVSNCLSAKPLSYVIPKNDRVSFGIYLERVSPVTKKLDLKGSLCPSRQFNKFLRR